MTIPTPSPIWGNITVTRSVAGVYTSGRWVPGATSPVTVRASVQPATPKQLERLPEGLRTKAGVSVWSTTALRTADEATGLVADVIAWDGASWEVQQVEHWGHYAPGMEHWRAVATRVDP